MCSPLSLSGWIIVTGFWEEAINEKGWGGLVFTLFLQIILTLLHKLMLLWLQVDRSDKLLLGVRGFFIILISGFSI